MKVGVVQPSFERGAVVITYSPLWVARVVHGSSTLDPTQYTNTDSNSPIQAR